MKWRSERKLRRKIAARYEPERRERQARYRQTEALIRECDELLYGRSTS